MTKIVATSLAAILVLGEPAAEFCFELIDDFEV